MDFKTFFTGLSVVERTEFAKKVGTTTGYCHQIIYGDKRIELGLADVFVAASSGKLNHSDLPLTPRAKFQMNTRAELAKPPIPA